MPTKEAPCLGCEDRRSACHDHCERYKEYREILEAKKAAKKAEKEFWRPLASSLNYKKKQHALQKCGRRWRG